eukprot:m.104894 g.104894  ORF g.104894 m.104894 type:complete len:4069 (-) comp9118_c0_seq1:256-12462(-)
MIAHSNLKCAQKWLLAASAALLLLPQVAAQEVEAERRVGSFFFLVFISAIAIVWFVYLIFFNSRFLALVVRFILRIVIRINWGAEAKNVYFTVGSIAPSLFGGNIAVRDLRFATPDYAITLVDGYFKLRYWSRSFRQTVNSQDTRGARVLLQLNGIALHCYNRTSVYDRLEQIIKTRENLGDGVSLNSEVLSTISEACESKSSEGGLPFFFKICPVMQIRINVGRFVVGNSQLPSTLFALLRRASLFVGTEQDNPCDLYTLVVRGKIHSIKARLTATQSYSPSIDMPPCFKHVGNEKKKGSSKDQHLKITEVNVEYFQAVPGQYQPGHPRNSEPPRWEARLTLEQLDATLPTNLNEQRQLMQEFFFPTDFLDRVPTPRPRAGTPRDFAAFKLSLKCDDKVKLTMPFQADIFESTNTKQDSSDQITLVTDTLEVDFVLPFKVSSTGYVTTLSVRLPSPFSVETSLPYFNLIDQCTSLALDLDMKTPIKFEDPSLWTIKIKAQEPIVHFVHMQIPFFKEFLETLNTKPAQIFLPCTYEIDLQLERPHLLWCANRYNVTDILHRGQDRHRWNSSLKSWANVLMDMSGSIVTVSWILQYLEPHPEQSAVVYKITVADLQCRLILPDWNTIHVNVPDLSEKACWTARTLSIVIGMSGPTNRSDPTTTDKTVMEVQASQLAGPLLGYYVLRLTHLWDNYFGEYISMTTSEVESSGRVNYSRFEAHTTPPRAAGSDFVLSVDIDMIAFSLPPQLYSMSLEDPQLRCDKLHLGLKIAHSNMALTCQIDPTTIHLQPGSIQLPNAKISANFFYGPKRNNVSIIYARHVSLSLGDLAVELGIPQLTDLLKFVSSFVFHLKDYDNFLAIPGDVHKGGESRPQYSPTKKAASTHGPDPVNPNLVQPSARLRPKPKSHVFQNPLRRSTTKLHAESEETNHGFGRSGSALAGVIVPPEEMIRLSESGGQFLAKRVPYNTADIIITRVHVRIKIGSDAAVQLLLEDGLRVTTDTLVRRGSNSICQIHVPNLRIQQFLRKDVAAAALADHTEWQEAGAIQTSILTKFRERLPNWRSLADEQLSFLLEQDLDFGRIWFLYKGDKPVCLVGVPDIRCPNLSQHCNAWQAAFKADLQFAIDPSTLHSLRWFGNQARPAPTAKAKRSAAPSSPKAQRFKPAASNLRSSRVDILQEIEEVEEEHVASGSPSHRRHSGNRQRADSDSQSVSVFGSSSSSDGDFSDEDSDEVSDYGENGNEADESDINSPFYSRNNSQRHVPETLPIECVRDLEAQPLSPLSSLQSSSSTSPSTSSLGSPPLVHMRNGYAGVLHSHSNGIHGDGNVGDDLDDEFNDSQGSSLPDLGLESPQHTPSSSPSANINGTILDGPVSEFDLDGQSPPATRAGGGGASAFGSASSSLRASLQFAPEERCDATNIGHTVAAAAATAATEAATPRTESTGRHESLSQFYDALDADDMGAGAADTASLDSFESAVSSIYASENEQERVQSDSDSLNVEDYDDMLSPTSIPLESSRLLWARRDDASVTKSPESGSELRRSSRLSSLPFHERNGSQRTSDSARLGNTGKVEGRLGRDRTSGSRVPSSEASRRQTALTEPHRHSSLPASLSKSTARPSSSSSASRGSGSLTPQQSLPTRFSRSAMRKRALADLETQHTSQALPPNSHSQSDSTLTTTRSESKAKGMRRTNSAHSRLTHLREFLQPFTLPTVAVPTLQEIEGHPHYDSRRESRHSVGRHVGNETGTASRLLSASLPPIPEFQSGMIDGGLLPSIRRPVAGSVSHTVRASFDYLLGSLRAHGETVGFDDDDTRSIGCESECDFSFLSFRDALDADEDDDDDGRSGSSNPSSKIEHGTTSIRVHALSPVEVFLTPMSANILEKAVNDRNPSVSGCDTDWEAILDEMQLQFMDNILREHIPTFSKETQLSVVIPVTNVRVVQDSAEMIGTRVAPVGICMLALCIDDLHLTYDWLNSYSTLADKSYSSNALRLNSSVSSWTTALEFRRLQGSIATAPRAAQASRGISSRRRMSNFFQLYPRKALPMVLTEAQVLGFHLAVKSSVLSRHTGTSPLSSPGGTIFPGTTSQTAEPEEKSDIHGKLIIARVETSHTSAALPAAAALVTAWGVPLLGIRAAADSLQRDHTLNRSLLIRELVRQETFSSNEPTCTNRRFRDPRWEQHVSSPHDLLHDKNWNLLMKLREQINVCGACIWDALTDTKYGTESEELELRSEALPRWYVGASLKDTHQALRDLAVGKVVTSSLSREADVSLVVRMPNVNFVCFDSDQDSQAGDNSVTLQGVKLQANAHITPNDASTVEAKVQFLAFCSELHARGTPLSLTYLNTAISSSEFAANRLSRGASVSSASASPARQSAVVLSEGRPSVDEGTGVEIDGHLVHSEPHHTASLPLRRNSSSFAERSSSFVARMRRTSSGRVVQTENGNFDSLPARRHPQMNASAQAFLSQHRSVSTVGQLNGRRSGLEHRRIRKSSVITFESGIAPPERRFVVSMSGLVRMQLVGLGLDLPMMSNLISMRGLVFVCDSDFATHTRVGESSSLTSSSNGADMLSVGVTCQSIQADLSAAQDVTELTSARRAAKKFLSLSINSLAAQAVLASTVRSIVGTWASMRLDLPQNLLVLREFLENCDKIRGYVEEHWNPNQSSKVATATALPFSVVLMLRDIIIKAHPLHVFRCIFEVDEINLTALRPRAHNDIQSHISIGRRTCELTLLTQRQHAHVRTKEEIHVNLPRMRVDASYGPAADAPGHARLNLNALITSMRVSLSPQDVQALLNYSTAVVVGLQELVDVYTPSAPPSENKRASTHAKAQLLITSHLHLSQIQFLAKAESGGTVFFDCGELDLTSRGELRDGSIFTTVNANTKPTIWFGYMDHIAQSEMQNTEKLAYFKLGIDFAAEHRSASLTQASTATVLRFTVRHPHVFIPSDTIQRMIMFVLDCQTAFQNWTEEHHGVAESIQNKSSKLFSRVGRSLSSATQETSSSLLVHVSLLDFIVRAPLLDSKRTSMQLQSAPSGIFLVASVRQISVTHDGSKGSIGRFKNLSLRFLETAGSPNDEFFRNLPLTNVQNIGIAPGGTVQIFTRTKSAESDAEAPSQESAQSKMIMALRFSLEGLNLSVDTKIGKYLSATSRTLESIADQIGIIQPFTSGAHGVRQEITKQLLIIEHLRSTNAQTEIINHALQQLRNIQSQFRTESKPKKQTQTSKGPFQRVMTSDSDPDQRVSSVAFEVELSLDITQGVCSFVGRPIVAPAFRREMTTDFPSDEDESLPNVTTFQIPRLSVRMSYMSDTTSDLGSEGNLRALIYVSAPLGADKERFIIRPLFLEFFKDTLTHMRRDGVAARSPALLGGSTSQANYERKSSESEADYLSLPVNLAVRFHLESSQITLKCNPPQEVECTVKLPAIDLFLSSQPSVADADTAGRQVRMQTITAKLSEIKLLIDHSFAQKSHLSDSALLLQVQSVDISATRSIQLVDHQRETTISTLVDIGSIYVKYDTQQLEELLTFRRAWFRKKALLRFLFAHAEPEEYRRAEETGSTTNNSWSDLSSDSDSDFELGSISAGSADAAASVSPVAQRQRLIHLLNIRETTVAINFGRSLGAVELQLTNSMVRGTNVMDIPRRSIYKVKVERARLSDTSFKNSPSTIRCDLTASQICFSGIFADYEDETPAEDACLMFIDVSLESLHAKLQFYSPLILIARVVNMQLRCHDNWLQANDMLLKALLNLQFTVGELDVMASRETAPNCIKIFDRIMTTIKDQREKFERKSVRTTDEPVRASPRTPMALGNIAVRGDRVNLILFNRTFHDDRHVHCLLSDFQLAFERRQDESSERRMLHTLLLEAGESTSHDPHLVIAKASRHGSQSLSRAASPQEWCQVLIETSKQSQIFSAPSFVIQSDIRLALDVDVVNPQFHSEFFGGLGVSLDVAQYLFLREVVESFFKRKSKTQELDLEELSLMPAAPELTFICQERKGSVAPPLRDGKTVHGHWCEFNLNPSLRPLTYGEVPIPDIDWLMLNFLKMKNPHQSINRFLYDFVHSPLCDILGSLAKSAAPKALLPRLLQDPSAKDPQS